jgi:hypothetical protein
MTVPSMCACAECTHQEMNPPVALLAVLSPVASRLLGGACMRPHVSFRSLHTYVCGVHPPPVLPVFFLVVWFFLVHCAMHTA